MPSTTAIVKRWGSSRAVILPAALIKELRVKEGDEVLLDVQRPARAFGLMKKYGPPKMTTQEAMDEVRNENRAREAPLEKAYPSKKRGTK